MDVIVNLKSNKNKGFVLITALFVMLLLLSLGIFAVGFTLTELRISSSQSSSIKTYYLAESGVAEAIWKIKNDPTWKTNFEENPNWNLTYTRNSALYPNGSYTINIINSDLAKGEITVTAYLNMGTYTSRRVIQTSIYKAIGISVIGQNGEFADGNIDMSGSVVNIFNGGFFSNLNIIINFWSVINATGDVKAVGNINTNQSSYIVASSTQDRKSNPPPTPIAMPAVSFDNVGDASSYKARASNIYTEKQFSDLLWNNINGTTVLNGITYVTGDISIKGPTKLIINGALAADGGITVGANTFFCCWGSKCDRSTVTINESSSGPSGLLSKGTISFELCLESFNAKGLIYGNDKVNVLSLPNGINIFGAIASRKITLTSLWQGFNITYDNDVVSYGLGDPQFSPIVTVEHWEEEY